MALLEKLEKGIKQLLWNFTAGAWWSCSPSCISSWDPGSLKHVCQCRWQGCFPGKWPWGQRLCYVTLHKVSSFKHPELWEVKKKSAFIGCPKQHMSSHLIHLITLVWWGRHFFTQFFSPVFWPAPQARWVHEMSKPQQHLRAIDEPEIERSHTRLST